MSLFNVYEIMKFLVPSCCYIVLPKHCCLGVLMRKALGSFPLYPSGRAISASLLAAGFESCVGAFFHKLSPLLSILSSSQANKVCHLSGWHYRVEIKEKKM